MASSVYRMIHSEKRVKLRDMNDVRTRASKRLKETRKSQREALLNLHRRVKVTPEVKKKKTAQEEVLLRLKSYKEEKLKRMEELKKSVKPPFYSLVVVRHTGSTPYKNKQAVKDPTVNLPRATRSRTAFQKKFEFKATLNNLNQNSAPQKAKLPIKSRTMGKENQPIESNLKTTVKRPLVKNVQPVINRKPLTIPVITNRLVNQEPVLPSTSRLRQKENVLSTTTSTRQRGVVRTNINNVAASVVDNAQKKKNEIKPKSALVSEIKKGKGKQIKSRIVSKSTEQISSNNASSAEVFNLKKEENKSNSKEMKGVINVLLNKVAGHDFIMSPLIESNSNVATPTPTPSTSTSTSLTTSKVVRRSSRRRPNPTPVKSKPVDETSSVGPEALRDKLDEETSRLSSTADTWSKRHTDDSNSNNIPEHIKDEILAVVGQTRLLISDKFQQFRSLINNALSEHQESAAHIKADDLLGFWEMMYLEVEQLNRKYENLANLAENGWSPLEKQKTLNKTKRKAKAKKPTKSASSKFKEFLKNKKEEEAITEEFNDISLQGTPTKRAPSLRRTLNSEYRTRMLP